MMQKWSKQEGQGRKKQWYHSKDCAGAHFIKCVTPYAIFHALAKFYATKSFSKVGRREQTVLHSGKPF